MAAVSTSGGSIRPTQFVENRSRPAAPLPSGFSQFVPPHISPPNPYTARTGTTFRPGPGALAARPRALVFSQASSSQVQPHAQPSFLPAVATPQPAPDPQPRYLPPPRLLTAQAQRAKLNIAQIEKSVPRIVRQQCHACARFYPMVPFLPDMKQPRTADGYYTLSKVCIRCSDRAKYQGELRHYESSVDKAIKKSGHPYPLLLRKESENVALRERLRNRKPLEIDVLYPMTDAQIPNIRYDVGSDEDSPGSQARLLDPGKTSRGGPRTGVHLSSVPNSMLGRVQRPQQSDSTIWAKGGPGRAVSNPTSSTDSSVHHMVATDEIPVSGGQHSGRIGNGGTGQSATHGMGNGVPSAPMNDGTGGAGAGAGGKSGGHGGPGKIDGSAHAIEIGDVCPIYWMPEPERATRWISDTFEPSSRMTSVSQKEVWGEYTGLFRDSPSPCLDGRTVIKLISDSNPGSCLGTAAETRGYRIFGVRRKPFASQDGEIARLYVGIIGRGRRRPAVAQTRADVGWTIKVGNEGERGGATGGRSSSSRVMLDKVADAAPAVSRRSAPVAPGPYVTPQILTSSKPRPATKMEPVPPSPTCRRDLALAARSAARSAYADFKPSVLTFEVHPGDIDSGMALTRRKLTECERRVVPIRMTRKVDRRQPEEIARTLHFARPAADAALVTATASGRPPRGYSPDPIAIGSSRVPGSGPGVRSGGQSGSGGPRLGNFPSPYATGAAQLGGGAGYALNHKPTIGVAPPRLNPYGSMAMMAQPAARAPLPPLNPYATIGPGPAQYAHQPGRSQQHQTYQPQQERSAVAPVATLGQNPYTSLLQHQRQYPPSPAPAPAPASASASGRTQLVEGLLQPYANMGR